MAASATGGGGGRDWSELPTDLTVLILGRLTAVDYARFGAVCTAWHTVTKAGLCPPAKQIPWLLFPAAADGNTTHRLFDLSTKKSYKMTLPEISTKQCIGASMDGRWVVYIGHDMELGMLNLHTRDRVSLPPLDTRWDIKNVTYDASGRLVEYVVTVPMTLARLIKHYSYSKVIMFSAGSPPGGPLSVALFCVPSQTVSVARVGDEGWTKLDSPFGLTDLAFHQGRLCAVDFRGNTVAWTMLDPATFSWSDAKRLASPFDDMNIYKKYLIPLADCGDELFQVWRDVRPILHPTMGHVMNQRTSLAKVFKLDPARDSWVQVNNLGGRTFFLGYNHSIILSTHEIDHLRANCIYFTDDDLPGMLRDAEVRHRDRDTGVFDLADGSWEPLPIPSGVVNFPSPIWVTPSLF